MYLDPTWTDRARWPCRLCPSCDSRSSLLRVHALALRNHRRCLLAVCGRGGEGDRRGRAHESRPRHPQVPRARSHCRASFAWQPRHCRAHGTARNRCSGMELPQPSQTPKPPVSSRASADWISSSSWRSRPSRRVNRSAMVPRPSPTSSPGSRAPRRKLDVRHDDGAKQLLACPAQQPAELGDPARAKDLFLLSWTAPGPCMARRRESLLEEVGGVSAPTSTAQRPARPLEKAVAAQPYSALIGSWCPWPLGLGQRGSSHPF